MFFVVVLPCDDSNPTLVWIDGWLWIAVSKIVHRL